MKAPVAFNRLPHHQSAAPRKPIQFFVSPVDATCNESQEGEVNASTDDDFDRSRSNRLDSTPSGASSTKHRVHFKPRHESTAIELFYDLFFVANLTIFTENNAIADAASMASYLGFFSLIWFNWLQVSLYDVRFATESVFNRLAKSIALFVMGLFAFAGPVFDTSNVEHDTAGFRLMSYALMVQRFTLAVQYGVVIISTRKYRAAVIPIALTIGVMIVTGFIFFGLVFSFHKGENSHSYIGLYVVSLLEAIIVVSISCVYRSVGYRSTNLVERVGLLTLIMLGEGIIGAMRSIATALLNTDIIKGTMIALAFGGIFLIHELWILYFDQIEHDRFGTIRQQIWTLLHFPLHLALILVLQGNTRFLVWKVFEDVNLYFGEYLIVPPVLFNGTSAVAYASALRGNLTDFAGHFKKNFTEYYDYEKSLNTISKLNITGGEGRQKATGLWRETILAALNFIFDAFDVEIPEKDKRLTGEARTEAALDVFSTAWLYFIIGSGFVLIILGFMYWFGKSHKSRFEWARLSMRIAVGVALTLTATASINDIWAPEMLVKSWSIPFVLIIYAVVILLDDILIWLGYRRYEKTKDQGTWEVERAGNATHDTEH